MQSATDVKRLWTVTSTNQPFQASSQARLKALFDELGSEARLEAILIQFYERMAKDLLLHHFFIGHDPRAVALQQKNFMLVAMGVRARGHYKGRPPHLAHSALPPLFPGHLDRRSILLKDLLQEEGLSADAIKAWVQFERAFFKAILARSSV